MTIEYFKRVCSTYGRDHLTPGRIYKVVNSKVVGDRGATCEVNVTYVNRDGMAAWEKSTEAAYKAQIDVKWPLNKNRKYSVLRTGTSSDRVTRGEVYTVVWLKTYFNPDGPDSYGWVIRKTDKAGIQTQPSLHKKSTIWKVLGFADEVSGMPEQDNLPGNNVVATTEKETTMSYQAAKIASVLMINGTAAKAYSDDDLIGLVNAEQEAVKKLKEVVPESSHISARIAKHEEATKALIVVLDSRKVEPLVAAQEETTNS